MSDKSVQYISISISHDFFWESRKNNGAVFEPIQADKDKGRRCNVWPRSNVARTRWQCCQGGKGFTIYLSSQCWFSKVKPERGNAVPLNYHSLLSLKSFCVLTSYFSYSYFSEMSKVKPVFRNVPGSLQGPFSCFLSRKVLMQEILSAHKSEVGTKSMIKS